MLNLKLFLFAHPWPFLSLNIGWISKSIFVAFRSSAGIGLHTNINYKNRKQFQIWHKGNNFKNICKYKCIFICNSKCFLQYSQPHSCIRTLPVTQFSTALCRIKYIYTCIEFFCFYYIWAILQKLAFWLQLGHVVAHTFEVLKARKPTLPLNIRQHSFLSSPKYHLR